MARLAERGVPVYKAGFQVNAICNTDVLRVGAFRSVVVREICGWFREVDLELGTNLEDFGEMVQPIPTLFSG